jgi:hypothetical protein
MIMKKYNVSLASLVLFFATGAAIGMGNQSLGVSLQNDTNRTIAVAIWYKNAIKATFKLKPAGQNPMRYNNPIYNTGLIESMGMSYSGRTFGEKGLIIDLKGAEDALASYNHTLFDAINTYYRINYYADKRVDAIMKIMEKKEANNKLTLIVYEIDWVDVNANKTVTTRCEGSQIFPITRK